MRANATSVRHRILSGIIYAATAAAGFWLSPANLTAQETGTVKGTVTRAGEGTKLFGVQVVVKGTGIQTTTGTNGTYTLQRVPAGRDTILIRWLGYKPQEMPVTVAAGGTQTVDAALEAQPVTLGDIVVTTASRAPERVVEAPAAVALVDTRALQNLSITGQAPLVLASIPGVDVVQSGVNDMNVNARGFNSSLNRRVLVLQDGRDLGIAFLGSQEWNGLSTPLEDLGKVEMVRGPGSALYGANAFSGVVNITTPTAREIKGTKLSLSGGELHTFRGDIRHAGVVYGGRIGYRANFGYSRSDTWSRSRTAFDSLDLRREYGPASSDVAPKNIERVPLRGQSLDPANGVALGDRDPLESIYGSGRLDFYADNGAVGTIEGGNSRVENEIFVTGIGRVQVNKAWRPWLRTSWGSSHYNLMAWYSGRRAPRGPGQADPAGQTSLAAGVPIVDISDIYHVEGQVNQSFAADRARVVAGASYRNYDVDTQGTIMDFATDNRSDNYYSGYGQVELKITPKLRGVVAARYDNGNLFKAQFSPKAALVFSPTPGHSIRATVNRAFQTANYSEFFLRVPVAAPLASPATLEGGIEALFAAAKGVPGPLGAAINGLNLPSNLPWNFSAQTPILALGNADLDVEKLTGVELGYKGTLSARAYVSADIYYNKLKNFITDLLPGVNPAYPLYSLNDGGTDAAANLAALDAVLAGAGLPANHPLRANIPALLAGYNQLNAGLVGTRRLATYQGQRAVVVSYTNAGEVSEKGIELAAGVNLTNELSVDASYTFFDFSVKAGTQAVGDSLLPNTPKHKVNLSVSYTGRQGFDAGASLRIIDRYPWAAGVFAGVVPSSQILNANVGYRINNFVRVHLVATNLLDQERFQLYGGSVIGRRLLGGVTATF